jgi:hypothetical protein
MTVGAPWALGIAICGAGETAGGAVAAGDAWAVGAAAVTGACGPA